MIVRGCVANLERNNHMYIVDDIKYLTICSYRYLYLHTEQH